MSRQKEEHHEAGMISMAMRTVIFFFMILISLTASAGSLSRDTTVILFPAAAHFDPDAKSWNVTIHGHLFEKKEDSLLRNLFINTLRHELDITSNAEASSLFKRRIRLFLTDSERWEKVSIKVGSIDFTMNRTGGNGHFTTDISIPESKIPAAALLSRQIDYRVIVPENDHREFRGTIYFVNESGYILVSDIDDTIKKSDVRNRKELFRNSFLKEFSAIPGMSNLFARMVDCQAGFAESGKRSNSSPNRGPSSCRNDILFYYVSASPWQLYPELEGFIRGAGFPEGVFLLKNFRVKDSDFFNLFMAPDKYKIESIEPLFKRYPKKQFILVGDSGEKDPEAYGALARKYPDQVFRILIRKAYPEDLSDRFRKAFDKVDAKKWILFDDPDKVDTGM